eukprot:s1175_g2.t1
MYRLPHSVAMTATTCHLAVDPEISAFQPVEEILSLRLKTSGPKLHLAMRQRPSAKRRADSPAAAEERARALAAPRTGSAATAASLLRNRAAKDFLARFAFVGIFIVENVLHAIHFEFEVDNMVLPAVAPLPYEFAVSLHLVHIIFGLFGAIFVLVSGFDTAGRTALTKGTSMMLVFMATITWTWWINRQGTLYWNLDPHPFWDIRCSPEKRNRTVHILKNFSIVGALTILQQLAKYESQDMGGAPSFLEGLITALRPWTFPAILGPQLVLLATLRSVLHEALPGYTTVFALLIALIAIQAAANLVNSYMDFKKGIDKSETAGDRTLVDGLVSMTTLKALGALCLGFWLTFFCWSVVATDFSSTVLGWATTGTLLAVGYTAGPAPLKYLGLGDLTVLICFGPGVIAYSSAVLIGTIRLEALILTLPAALYVVAILHANNYRDIEVDKQGAVEVSFPEKDLAGQGFSIDSSLPCRMQHACHVHGFPPKHWASDAMSRPSEISTGGYGRLKGGSKSTPSPHSQFEARLCWGEIENPNASSTPVSPASAPGHLEKARGKLLKSRNGSNGSLGSVSTPLSTASCPNLRRPTGRQQALARLRPSPTNPRPLVPSGENLNGSASLANWRDYIDDKRRNPYRGIRGGFAPPSWYKIMTGSQTYLVR